MFFQRHDDGSAEALGMDGAEERTGKTMPVFEKTPSQFVRLWYNEK